jgi:hypothetical protein
MRTTMIINDNLMQLLKRRALDSGESVSALVEDAIKYQVLEDYEDIEDAVKRLKEPSYSFDKLVAELKSEGLL